MGVKIYIFGFGEFGCERFPERPISHYCHVFYFFSLKRFPTSLIMIVEKITFLNNAFNFNHTYLLQIN